MKSGTINIGYAEDHQLIREGIIQFINDHRRCTVIIEAANGLELIEKINASAVLPDICILDVGMPVLNGHDTIVRLKSQHPQMKFLILSMYDTEYNIIRMIKNGANGFLQKNCHPKELHQAILAIYSKGYYYSQIASERAFEVVKNNVIPELTEKELRFLCLCSSDLTFAQIAEHLGLSVRTLDDYEERICKKLNLKNRTDLALFAVSNGLVPLRSTSRR